MKENVLSVLEVDDFIANKLLKSNCCVLLETFKVSTFDYEFPQNTRMGYSMGQIKYDKCDKCGKDSVLFIRVNDHGEMFTKGICKECSNEFYIKEKY